MAALTHPHIVTLHSTEQHGDLRFLTMELVEGRTLDQLIPPAGVEIAQFFDIAIALCAAAAGLRQEALSWARKVWEIRDPFQYFARYHPDYEWLRVEPEFQAILREMDAAPATNM